MTYVNQLHIEKFGPELNKEFFTELYHSGLDQVVRFFDRLDSAVSIHRLPDPDMTPEKLLQYFKKDSIVILQLGSPTPFEIRYGAIFYDANSRIHSFIECPYTADNFNKVSDIYSKVFKTRLEDEPVLEGLIEYYEGRVKLGY